MPTQSHSFGRVGLGATVHPSISQVRASMIPNLTWHNRTPDEGKA